MSKSELLSSKQETNRDKALRGEPVVLTDDRLREIQQICRKREGCMPSQLHWHWLAMVNELIDRRAHETTDIRIENLTRALHAKQAKIDALMLEFCPGEMSAEQKAEWAKHQKSGSPEEPSELPESLRDPIKVMERGQELLANWGPTPITDAALAASDACSGGTCGPNIYCAKHWNERGVTIAEARSAEKATAQHPEGCICSDCVQNRWLSENGDAPR